MLKYTKICVICGKKFETNRYNKSVCSADHYKQCKVCGKQFELKWPYTAVTCSAVCRGMYRRSSGAGANAAEKAKQTKLSKYGTASNITMLTKICKYCGKEFETTSNRRVYCYDKHYGACPVCGKLVEIHDMSKGPSACSKECRQKLIEKTNIEKYGSSCVFQNAEIKDKIKENNLEKYGVDHYSKTDEYKEKFIQTSKTRYGTEHPLQNAKLQNKKIQTTAERYGGNSPTCDPAVAAKAKQSGTERYGGLGLASAQIKAKIDHTNLLKYGTTHPAQSEVVRQHYRDSMLQRYGGSYQHTVEGIATCISNGDKAGQYLKFKDDPSSYIESNYAEKPLISQLCKDLGVTDTPIYNILIRHDCKDIIERKMSKIEHEVIEYIKYVAPGVTVIHNSKQIINPYELDIYIPDKKLGIECNPTVSHNSSFGDPWSSDIKSPSYHKRKTDMCESKGIQLFHIFGYEWTHKRAIIESMIANCICATQNTVWARNTYVSQISSNECKSFLDSNHRQGNTFASIRLGLRDKKSNELVSVMTFNKVRSTIGKTAKFDGYELSRFCSKLNTSVVGGASKLFKYFTTRYPDVDVVSFSDKAHTSGKLYEILGFDKVNESTPSYVWVNMKDDTYYNRVNCQKKNLRKLFHDDSIDVENKTEKQIMEEHGYARVFDSGTIRWEYTNTNKSL